MKAFTLFSLCGLLFITPALAQSNLEPLNHLGTSIPETLRYDGGYGPEDLQDLCEYAEDGSITDLKRKLRSAGVDLNSPAFWAIKCEKLSDRQTSEPNLL